MEWPVAQANPHRRCLEQRVVHAIEADEGVNAELRGLKRRLLHAGDLLHVVAVAGSIRPQAHGQTVGHANVVTAQPEAKTGDAGGIEHRRRVNRTSSALATTAHEIMRPRRRLFGKAGDTADAIKLRKFQHVSSPCGRREPVARQAQAMPRRLPRPAAPRSAARPQRAEPPEPDRPAAAAVAASGG